MQDEQSDRRPRKQIRPNANRAISHAEQKGNQRGEAGTEQPCKIGCQGRTGIAIFTFEVRCQCPGRLTKAQTQNRKTAQNDHAFIDDVIGIKQRGQERTDRDDGCRIPQQAAAADLIGNEARS